MIASRLNFHRRHGRHCEANQPLGKLTGETEERKRGAKKCSCSIFASGTLAGDYRKVGTGCSDWDAAIEAVKPFLEAGSWEAAPPVTATPPPVPAPASGTALVPLDDAIRSFFQDLKASHTAEDTMRGYRYVLTGRKDQQASGNATLVQFARERGIRYLQELEQPGLLRQLYLSWNVGVGTRRKRLSVLKSFFEFFIPDGVLKTNPARLIKPRRNRAARTGEDEDNQPRLPFTDEELARMISGCGTYGKLWRAWPKKKDGRQVVAITEHREYARKWDGEDLAHFIEISVQTGLRISDVATFHVSRLEADGTVRLRATKNGTWITVPVSAALQKTIRERARKYGPYIFGDPGTRTMHAVTQHWRKRLDKLWEENGPWTQEPVHHRFRHAFVRILLQRHVPVAVVARLIGDTEEMVRKHYSNFVPELQEALTAATRHAFDHLPSFQSA
jgi:site-specific recombinase XerD